MTAQFSSDQRQSARRQFTVTIVAIVYLLTLALFYRTGAVDLSVAILFSALFYAALFSVGDDRLNDWSRLPDAGPYNVLLFPLILSLGFFCYVFSTGNNPLAWPTIALPLVLSTPAVFFF